MLNNFIFDHSLEANTGWTALNDDMEADLTLPMLPPPKRFLLEDSVFNTSPETIYTVFKQPHERRKENKHAVDLDVNKIRLYKDKIQLIRIRYFFDRKKQFMAESRGGFKMLTYSADKRALFLIKNEKLVTGRFKRTIRRISLNVEGLQLMFFNDSYFEQWVKALHNMIKEDIPNLCDECTVTKNRVVALVLQHRIGKSLPGLTDGFIQNLSTLSSNEFILDMLYEQYQENNDDTFEQGIREINKYKRKTVYKFIPILKKTNSTNKAFRALIEDKYYSNMLIKMLHDFDLNSLTRGSLKQFIKNYNTKVPNSVKHLLKNFIKTNQRDKAASLIKELRPIIHDLKDNNNVDISWVKTMISNWVKTSKRIDNIIPWFTWRDLYNMSNTLNLRVRPSCFKSLTDVNQLHDEYSRFIAIIENKKSYGIPKELMTFVEVNTPKEFNGYKIKQLLSHKDLVKESDCMGHCVHTYGNSCMSGRSIIFSIRDKYDKRLWTTEFNGSFNLIQTEGKVGDGYMRTFPEDSFVSSFLIPFSRKLQEKVDKKAISYPLKSELRVKQIETELSLFSYTLDGIGEEMAKNLKLDIKIDELNYKLEALIEINRIVENSKHVDMKELSKRINALDSIGLEIHIPEPALPLPVPQEPIVPDNVIEAAENDLLLRANNRLNVRAACTDELFDTPAARAQQVEDIEEQFPF